MTGSGRATKGRDGADAPGLGAGAAGPGCPRSFVPVTRPPDVGVCADTSDDKTADSKTATSNFFTFTPPTGVVDQTSALDSGQHFVNAPANTTSSQVCENQEYQSPIGLQIRA